MKEIREIVVVGEGLEMAHGINHESLSTVILLISFLFLFIYFFSKLRVFFFLKTKSYVLLPNNFENTYKKKPIKTNNTRNEPKTKGN